VLIEDDQGSKVAVVQTGKVAFFTVKTGLEDFTKIEIVDGLAEGAQVIITQGETYIEGELVEVVNNSQ
jgi:hypothetical protein